MAVALDGAATVVAGVPTTTDAFLGGAVHLIQPASGYRAGVDAVLLAAAVPVPPPRSGTRLLDVGAGVGTVGICAAARVSSLDVTLLERDPVFSALARTNIKDNDLSERARVIEQDLAVPADPRPPELADNSFDITVANPPFYDDGRHRRSPDALKAAAHGMPGDGLDSWARFMARMTRAGGRALIIHRADLVVELLAAFAPRFGGLAVLPIYPREGEAAIRILVIGTKGSRAPLAILPGLVLHGATNRFTPAIDTILKSPTALPLGPL